MAQRAPRRRDSLPPLEPISDSDDDGVESDDDIQVVAGPSTKAHALPAPAAVPASVAAAPSDPAASTEATRGSEYMLFSYSHFSLLIKYFSFSC